ncbi:M15 family metallopeptidase [uncultured Muriicola sp.]|uniref:M15 family metallopeptidase n=1 Tax=uncultured Muriicola sp. TaxID=1583102 RepID=UPI00260E8A70|nr:M15 family metallopeptidase [uncultured Muriicola sp.]
MKKLPFLLVIVFIIWSCREKVKESAAEQASQSEEVVQDSVIPEASKPLPSLDVVSDTTFIRLADFSEDFAYELRYATENNFLKTKVYDCAECYTRSKTAKALIAANNIFKEKGFRIRFFDCYRPNSVQYKMWEIFPNPQYVADPVKGSIHNKGGAVDITLETLDGIALNMGTDFDYFGREAHHDHLQLPDEVLRNRALLKEVMEAHGFWSIRTEWWHYNLGAATNDPVANFKWTCP